MAELSRAEAIIDNRAGRAPVLLVCDHAANAIPDEFAGLGLDAATLADHVAWDVGALALARRLAASLDAALIAAPVSRLVVDPNRAPDAHDLVPLTAEGAHIPGNANLDARARAARIGDKSGDTTSSGTRRPTLTPPRFKPDPPAPPVADSTATSVPSDSLRRFFKRGARPGLPRPGAGNH